MSTPFAQPATEVIAELGARYPDGLDEGEVAGRRARHGTNRLVQQQAMSVWLILINQFRSLIVLLLLAALVLSAVTASWLEAIAIGVVMIVNGAIGFVSELGAVRSMEALRRLGEAAATVRRDGVVKRIAAVDLVPADVVLLEAGDVVTADLRIVDSSKLRADESMLTGESMPVEKGPDPVAGDAVLAEQASMLFKGTAVTRGVAEGIVCATGMQTELGQITALMQEGADEGLTPLERRLDQLGRKLVWLTIAIAIVVAALGIVQGKDPYLIIKTSIALAVAAIPEGLPIVATLALARGMRRMIRRNVLVNRLAAVETLGATTVVFADKTGTLTENRMAVSRVATCAGDTEIGGGAFEPSGTFRRGDAAVTPDVDPDLMSLLEVGVLCSNASWSQDETTGERAAVGEPMEVALIVVGAKAGLDQDATRARLPEIDQDAFDSSVNMMATYHRVGDRVRVAVKGAPEAVLDASTHGRDGALDDTIRARWLERNADMAESGLRVLGLAEKTVDTVDGNPYAKLTFLGLAGFVDPPRQEVRKAIEACGDAGVRVVMVTGDQPSTARYVASAVGLTSGTDVIHGRDLVSPARLSEAERRRLSHASVFARVSPRQKLDLIRLYQQEGEVVAMMGDGVNDAPALKSADIGVAMGLRGTDVAREAADMVLRDDAFGSIVAAIGQGRIIFDNIRSFIRYLISCNLSEIIVVLLGVAAGTPLPILPLQILFLNLITDVFPALALGLGEGDSRIMTRPPRPPKEPLLTRRHWIENVAFSGVIAVAVLGSLLIALRWLDMEPEQAVTISFLTLAFAQLWHVFNMRAPGSNPIRNQVTRNPFVWAALVLCIGLLLAAVYVPWLAAPLETTEPGTEGWILVGVMSVLPLIAGQVWLGWGAGDVARERGIRPMSTP